MAQIDTLKYYKDLKAGGVSDEQAEAEIRALQSALDGLATKEDLHNEFNILNKKIASVEAGLNTKIDSVEARLNVKIDSIKTIGWALFSSWLTIAIPVFKLAFFSYK